jgi:DNA polymerase
MTRCVLDLETRSAADLVKVGAEYYARHPSTGVWCGAFAFDAQPAQIWPRCEAVPPAIVAAVNDPACSFVAHNVNFEYAIWLHILHEQHGWPLPPPIERWRDTMVLASMLALPPELALLCKAIGLRHQKANSAIMHKMRKPREARPGEDPAAGPYWNDNPEDFAALCRYCLGDVEAERAVHDWFIAAGCDLTPAEFALWCLDHKINARGFYVDRPLVDKACELLTLIEHELQAQFCAATGLSFGQIEKTRQWLAAHGCKLPDLQKHTVAGALDHGGWTKEARHVLELRAASAGSAAHKFRSLRNQRCLDGRVRGSFNFHKAATGRWSASGVQPQNVKREVKDIAAKFDAVMSGDIEALRALGSPLGILGDVVRAAICAAPGHQLWHMDYSAIESRILAWITNEIAKLTRWAAFDQTQSPDDDPYVWLGRTLGFPEAIVRTAGKVCDLAFGFGGGVPAFRKFCRTYAVDDSALDDDQVKQFRDAWRGEHPRTQAFWYAIEGAALQAMHGVPQRCGPFTLERREHGGIPFLFIKLPSGRELAYPQARLISFKDKFDRDRTAITFMDNQQGQWAEYKPGHGIWGGTFCENLTQAVARDVLADALMRAEAHGFPIVLHVHDALVCEVPLS